MKMKKKIVIIIVLVLLVYGLASVFYNHIIIDEIVQKPITGEVISGSNLVIEAYTNVTNISLGKMKPGLGSTTPFQEINNKTYPVKVSLKATGAIKDLVFINPKTFILEPGEEKVYKITFQPSISARPGIYTGSLIITKKRTL
jgi:hypothetical protein